MSEKRILAIREALSQKLVPETLEITDESHLHAGHAGAKDGRGHFRVDITSKAFDGLTRVQRHQLVYSALGELMRTEIHALSLSAKTVSNTDTEIPESSSHESG